MSTQHSLRPASTTPGAPAAEPGAFPLAILLSGIFLVVLDFFIVNVALPSVQRDLHAGDTTLEWLVAGYGLAFGGLLLVAGRLGDRWGRTRTFGTGVALFVIASAACGLAPDSSTLMVARVLQGAAAAAVAPTVLALIGDVYAGPHRLRALGIYSTVMGVAAASGQLIGGVLIHADIAGLGWRTIFLVNVPIGIAAVALAPRALPLDRTSADAGVDVTELLLSTAVLVGVMLPLLEGRTAGWPLWTWACLAASVVLAGLLRARGAALRRNGHRPLLDLAPLAPRPVAFGIVAQTMLFVGMASYFLVLALYLQQGRGLGPLSSGLVFSILAVSYMVGTRQAAGFVVRLGRGATIAGAALFGAGHLLQLAAVERLGVDGSVLWLAPGLAVAGLGMGIALAALVGTVMATVEPADAGTVSGMFSTMQQIGNALGVALVGNVYFGLLDRGSADAFAASLGCLVVTTVAVGVMALGLPRATRAAVPA
jgi:MFS family permease